VDGSFHTLLSLGDGSLILEDAKTAMGTVEPLTRFGPSGFGPLQVRVLSAEGVAGDWLPLGTLVRVPGFKDLRCARAASKTCTLTAANLFLASSIAASPDLIDAADVPPDFTGTQMTVPHSANGTLYLKLRDDPATVQTLTLPVTLPTPPAPIQPAAAAPGSPPTAQPEKPAPQSIPSPAPNPAPPANR
jgi:hypothetical protein